MKEFKSLTDFNVFLKNVVAESSIRKRAILDVAAQYVEDESKRKFGIYQREDTEPFEAWQELAPATKEDRIRKGFSPNDPLYRTGDLMHSIYHSVVSDEVAVIGSDEDIMLWQEKGTPNAKYPIPPRSVLGMSLFQSKFVIQKIALEGMIAWITGKSAIKRRP